MGFLQIDRHVSVLKMIRSSPLIIYDIFTFKASFDNESPLMSVSVGTNEQRIETFYLSNKQKQGLKYLNSKRIKTHRRPCCADLCMRMDLPLDKKLWKIRTGPPGRRPARPWRAVVRGPAFSKTQSFESLRSYANITGYVTKRAKSTRRF